MRKSAICGSVAFCIAAFPSAAAALTVNIDSSHSTTAYTATIDTSVLFDPSSGPVTATGTIDLSNLGPGVLFVGLISKVDYDRHVALPDSHPSIPEFRFFVDTAYASFQSTPNAGLGQYLQGGELTQRRVSKDPLPSAITAFEASFGATSMSLTVQSLTTMLNYNFNPDNLTFTADGSPYTDFTEGAYAFVGTWFGDTTFNVTFDGPGSIAPVPLPAAFPLLGAGVGLLGLVARKRRRSTSSQSFH